MICATLRFTYFSPTVESVELFNDIEFYVFSVSKLSPLFFPKLVNEVPLHNISNCLRTHQTSARRPVRAVLGTADEVKKDLM